MPALPRNEPIDWSTAQTALRDWYATPLGQEVHAQVAGAIERLLRDRYALHCLQLGGTRYGVDLLAGRALIHRIHMPGDGADSMRAEPTALPLATASIDLVVLCHALEFNATPHALLREVDRVLALDGQVLVVGFNPWSLFGVRSLIARKRMPWCGHFYGPGRVADWFGLLGWRPRARESVWFGPPVQRDGVRRRLRRLDLAGRWLPGQGGIYLMLAEKHSIPFTPVPLRRLRADKPVVGRAVRPTQATSTEPCP